MNYWLLEIGLFTILGQVVLLRELNVAFFGTELIYILSLGIWLFWTALGATVGRRNRLPSQGWVRGVFLACAPLLIADILFIRRIHSIFGGVPGADLPFLRQLAAMALALMPISLLFGLLFQWTAKLYLDNGRTLALAYAIESGGGLIGGASATLFLNLGLQNFSIALICSLIAVIAAAHPVRWRGAIANPSFGVTVPAGLIGLLLLLALSRADTIDKASTAWSHPQLLDALDTPYGRIAVSGRFGQISVFQNNALVFESEGTSAEEMVHIAASNHSGPQSFLIIGGSLEGMIREAQKYRPRRITAVELDRRAWELVSRYLPRPYLQSENAPRAEIQFADPRQYLNRTSGKYDVILAAMPEPASAQTNRYYTRGFFQLCAKRLNPGGVLAFRLRSAENLWTPNLLQRAASIEAALKRAFSSTVVLPGTTNIFIASQQSLTGNPRIPASRLESRKIRARLISPLYINYLYTNDRFEETRRKLASAPLVPNTDSRPICYQYTLMIWLSKFYPRLAVWSLSSLLEWNRKHAYLGWLALLAVPAALRLARRRPGARRALTAGAAGLLGMVAESSLLIGYQVKSGILYQDLGLLVTLFMGGLVAGSSAVHRMAEKRRPDRPISRGLGAILLLAFGLLNLALAWLQSYRASATMTTIGSGLFIGGALVSGLFAYASQDCVENQPATVSPLYAADLIGGCLGSLAASLLLIPMVGLASTFGLMTIISVAALALI